MSPTPRPTLFSAAIELLPHLAPKPLAECTDEEIQSLAQKGVRIARFVAAELSESPWGPTIAPMPTLANLDQVVLPKPDGTRPEWLRLPKGRCPFTGLSRSTLYELVGETKANGYRPQVKSIVIRKRGAARGIRLISYDSLMAYLESLKTGVTETNT